MTSAERLTNLNQLRWDDLGTSLRRAKLPTERWDPISVKLASSSSCKPSDMRGSSTRSVAGWRPENERRARRGRAWNHRAWSK